MLLAPNGKVFNPGPQQTSRWLNTTGTGAWTNGPASTGGFRSYGSAVMYEPGKVLIVGGNDPPRATAEKIDLNVPTPAWQPAGTMASARRQLNATVLPDGTVLVTGGSSAAGFNAASGAVYTAELWDPAQPAENAFTTLASATRYRGYHSIALLLPDGRVLSSGGDNEPNAEVFSPPYLFKGARPASHRAPSEISYGSPFFVQTPDATSISAVTLVRLSAVTHAFNMNQRLVRLAFSQATGGLTAPAPPAGEVAPPGHYMLFLLNTAGVPSIARIVRLSNDAVPLPAADELERLGHVDQPDQSLVDRQRIQRNGFPNRAIFRWNLVHRDQHGGDERHDLRRRWIDRVDPGTGIVYALIPARDHRITATRRARRPSRRRPHLRRRLVSDTPDRTVHALVDRFVEQ